MKKYKYNSFHIISRKLFLKPYCEKCGITKMLNLKIYKNKFHMHCVSGDYTIMKVNNWKTLCHRCHSKLKNEEKQFLKYDNKYIENKYENLKEKLDIKITGRPKKGKYIYDQYIAFTCSKKESEQIREISKERRLSLSEMLREIINRKLNIITD